MLFSCLTKTRETAAIGESRDQSDQQTPLPIVVDNQTP